MTSKKLIREFITALDEEIEAIKSRKGGSAVLVFDGQFVRENSGIFVYSFRLENFISAIDDAPAEVKIGDSNYRGQIIQTRGLEVIIGIDHDLGKSIHEARLTINSHFLYRILKEKFEAARDGKFALANRVFKNKFRNPHSSAALPSLEPHPGRTPNKNQQEAIETSQRLRLTLVWGPPGTGKTQTLAWIVECFVKRGMRVLVVAHANAAVDEATEDIAKTLRATEYYNQGQIIRLGNYQKETLRTDYDLVLLEKISERLGTSLKQEKEQLGHQGKRVGQDLALLSSALEAIQERDTLSDQTEQLTDAAVSNNGKITKTKSQIAQHENNLTHLRTRKEKAESSGAFKRFLLNLHPGKIRKKIDRATVQLDGLCRQLHELESRSLHIEQRKSAAGTRLYAAKKQVDSLLRDSELLESELQSREKELNAEKDRIPTRISEIQEELDGIQKRVLSEARVVCTTLTKTFSAKEFPDIPFDVLVADEASMSPMPHLYWALSRCRKSAVIVGDFLQLSPICTAEKDMAQRWLKRSIYDHLGINTVEKAESDPRVRLLETQYRMNPAISVIPNKLFYEGRLSDDQSTHKYVISEGLSSSPLTMIDTTSASPRCSRLSTGSRYNVYSALLASTIAKKALQNADPDDYRIGIISPYRVQARLIGKILKDMELDRLVQVATIHRFQGGEADIIIFDSVESPEEDVAPMLNDPLPLNVAMTRAKCKIFLIANVKHLRSQLSTETAFSRIMDEFEHNGQRIDCEELVDSYFVRSASDVTEPLIGSLFTERNFYPAFFEDLRKAKEKIIILSPFVSVRRSARFVELFRKLIQKGVKIRLFTRPAEEHANDYSPKAQKVINQMRGIDAEVIEVSRMHQKIAIIDDSVAWEGSLNILSHRYSGEQMRRLPFPTAVKELIRFCELKESHTSLKAWKQSDGEPVSRDELMRDPNVCPQIARRLLYAIDNNRSLKITYSKPSNGDTVKPYTIRPIDVIRKGKAGFVYICTYGRPDEITYRLDRVLDARVIGGPLNYSSEMPRRTLPPKRK